MYLAGTGNGEVDTTGGTNYSVKALTRFGVASSQQQLLQSTLIMLLIVVHLLLQLLQLSIIQIQLMEQRTD